MGLTPFERHTILNKNEILFDNVENIYKLFKVDRRRAQARKLCLAEAERVKRGGPGLQRPLREFTFSYLQRKLSEEQAGKNKGRKGEFWKLETLYRLSGEEESTPQ